MAPFRIARAIKLAGLHPAVRETRVVGTADRGDVTVEFDFETMLPAAWRLAGQSPIGVREIEPVTFAFPAGYPLYSPRITLRPDFNRSHPHINPGSPRDPPVPCIVAGSPRELVQSRGIEALVDQMASWLDRASMVALNDPAQGWEPVRRDNIDDLMVVDGVGIRAFADTAGGSALLQTAYMLVDERDMRVYGINHTSCVPLDLAKATSSRGSLSATRHAGQGLGLVFWASDRSPGGPFVVSQYAPETVSTVRELRERAKTYGCQSQFDGLFNQLALGIHDRKVVPTPLAITFLVRRPFNVIGTGSPIELCSYVIHMTSSQDLIDEDRPIVRLCAVREQLCPEILRRVSGDDPADVRVPWTLVGCGSVGSKIAVHMARRGDGPSRLVDHGLMEPHNYGRHALLPTLDGARGAGGFKAHLLADGLQHFGQPALADVADAVELFASEEGRRKVAGPDAGLLNTTASTLVREHLAFVGWTDRPAIGEAHLLGSGRLAYAAFEGTDGNPNLSDLAAESYRLIAEDPELRSVVFDAKAQAIAIGQGCSAVTFPMADDRLSALASGLGQAVATRRFARRGDGGEIRLGKLERDGLSQTWTQEVVEPWTIVPLDGGIEVRISGRVDRLIRQEVARRPGSETGGVIVGRFSHVGNAFQVVDVWPAPSDSEFSSHKFVLGTIGMRAAIRRLETQTGGALSVLGTWHNHLIESAPSWLDAETAARLAVRQHLPVLLLIALPDRFTGLVAEVFDGVTFEPARSGGGAAPRHGLG